MLAKSLMRNHTSSLRSSGLIERSKPQPGRKGKFTASSVNTSDATKNPASEDFPSKWDKITENLVGFSAAPFSITSIPQVLQSFAAIQSGNPQALSIISWQGIISYTFGNTLMSSHFASRKEISALFVQLISVVNSFLMLSQLAYTGYMPLPAFTAVLVAAGVAAAANVSNAFGWLPPSSDGLWRGFQVSSGILGLSLVPQVVYSVVCADNPSLAPFAAAFTAICAWLYWQAKNGTPEEFNSLREGLPGTAATALFCLGPLPQLVKNFLDPTTLGGLSLGTLLLGVLGNSIMLPRALRIKDPIWLVGCGWANLAGWLTMLSLNLGKSSVTGESFLDARLFFAISLVMAAWFTTVFVCDTKAKGNSSVATSISEIFSKADTI